MKTLTLLLVICAKPVGADGLSFGGGGQSSQFGVLDERAALESSASIDIGLPVAIVPGLYDGDYDGPYLDMARDAARRYGVPESIFLRLVTQESNWNPNALSHKGAIGLAQLMPGTARVLGVDPSDPYQNLDGGARYLRAQYDTFRSWRLALAAYNAGPDAVERFGGIPPYQETQNYVAAILDS